MVKKAERNIKNIRLWPVPEIVVSPVRMYVRGYYDLVVVTPPPCPQTLHRSR